MCAVNNYRKMYSEKLTFVLEQISKSNITLSDIENSVGLIQKLSDILICSKVPLSLLCTIEDDTGNSNECILQNQLKQLRALSIALLNCRKNIPKRNHLRRVSKRPSETNNDLPQAKRRNIDDRDSHLVIQQPEASEAGMGLLDICYICKEHCVANTQRHEFYPWMCIKCGDENFKKRNQIADLNGKVALVTGGRIKIGFEIVLKLLRSGASVITTTRFPNDARRRYALENDFSVWTNRLHIYGLDLRFIPQVEAFCNYMLTNFCQLDIFIQNAAQTIRHPTVYYKNLIDGERKQSSITSNSNNGSTSVPEPANMQMLSSLDLDLSICYETSQILVHPEDFKYAYDLQLSQQHFPFGGTDENGDQLDLRPKNTWITALDEVETQEMVEVTLANYMCPFILLKKLTPIMATEDRRLKSDWGFIILVSAMEGKFSDCKKTGKHPHTNAAKAALNMLVKTSSRHYKKMGILMNAVDTGWVTDEHPVGCKSRLITGLKTPLDSIDGAARVLDPIFRTVNNPEKLPLFGKFLKDYQVTGW